MSQCPLSRVLAPLALAAVIAAGVAHADEPKAEKKLVQKVYAVADLVVPIPGMPTNGLPAAAPVLSRCTGADGLERVGFDFNCAAKPCAAQSPACGTAKCAPPAAAPATCHDQLIKLVQASIAPQTWAESGGQGTIEYAPAGMGLVVSQSHDVHEQIAGLLETLRKQQDVQVALEVRIVRVSNGVFDDYIAKEFGLLKQPTTLVDEKSVAQLMERVQGDCMTNVVQTPKVTTFSGQEATVRVADERFFVTGLQAVQAHTQTLFVPQNQSLSTGFTMTARPTILPDRQTVMLDFRAEVTEITDATVPVFPVTTFITPVFEGGAQGQPIPFTQFLQQPTTMKRGVTKVMGIPAGQSAVIYGGRGTHTVNEVSYAPILGHIPLIGELFRSEMARQESDNLIFVVTPRVIVRCEREEKHAAAATATPRSIPVGVIQASATDVQPRCAGPACREMDLPLAPAPKPAVTPCPTAAPCCPVMSQPACCAAPRPTPVVEALPMPVAGPWPRPPQIMNNMPYSDRLFIASIPCPEMQVKVDMAVMAIDEAFFAKPEAAAWTDLSPKSCDGKPRFVAPEETERFVRVARAGGAKLMSQPTVMTLNDQQASIHTGGEQDFVVGVSLAERDGKPVPAFRHERRSIGTTLTLRPTISADHKYVQLQLMAECSKPSECQPAGCKVTIEMIGENDGREKTAMLHMPAFNVQQMAWSFTVPVGRSVMVYGPCETAKCGARQHTVYVLTPQIVQPTAVRPVAPPMMATPPVSPTYSVPVVAAPAMPVVMPYGYPPTTSAPLLRVVEEQIAPPPAPRNAKLAKLMDKYRQACAEGRMAAAKKLAAKCLEIDPTCFGTDR